MTYTTDFECWWRDTGRFLPPADTANGEAEEQFKMIAAATYQDVEQQLGEDHAVKLSELEDRLDDQRSNNDGLKDEILVLQTHMEKLEKEVARLESEAKKE